MSANFLSDLGMTVAYNRQRNWLGAGLFVASLLLLVVGLGHTVVRIARRLSDHPAAQRWARAAVVASALAAFAFAGVAVTPENQFMAVHVAFTQWAWRIMPVVAGLLAVASFRSPGMPQNVGPSWLIVTFLLAGYALFLEWGPSVATANGLAAQVIAQKTIAVVVLTALLFVSHALDRPPMVVAGGDVSRAD